MHKIGTDVQIYVLNRTGSGLGPTARRINDKLLSTLTSRKSDTIYLYT